MANASIVFKTAGTILFGNGSLDRLCEFIAELKAQKILVITDKGIKTCGILHRFKSHLGRVDHAVYDDIEETPSLQSIRNCTDFAIQGGFDLIIGLGGGSAMDAAKAVSVCMTNPGDIRSLLGSDTIRVAGVKKILLPTTSGTGSEVTRFSVLSETLDGSEMLTGISDKHLLPEIAIVDPTLTATMPPALTANTGIDALSHAVESYLNIRSNFHTEPLALKAVELLTANLARSFGNESNPDARYQMSAGSVLAGMSLSQTGGGLAHALAETIQIPYRLAHGAAISVVLPHVMAYNRVENPQKYAKIALAMGVTSTDLSTDQLAATAVQHIRDLIGRVGLPTRLAQFGIPENDLAKIAGLVFEIAPGLLKVNPRAVTQKDLLEILRKAY